jgi:peptidoglycan/LPS O-acetylase OafA/YrhL
MYLLLPAIFLLIRKLDGLARIVVWIVGMFLSEIALAVIKDENSILIYFPCFLAGILAFRKSSGAAPSWMLPAGLSIAVLTYSSAISGAGLAFYYASWFFCLVMGLALPAFREVRSRPIRKAAKWLATHSYGIYLVHAPLLWICFVWLKASLPVQIAAFFAADAIIPIALYRFIEHPMIRFGRQIAERERRIAPIVEAAEESVNA